MGKLTKIRNDIKPSPLIIELGGESLEFHQLTFADFAEIEKQTGVDLTRAAMRSRKDPDEVLSSNMLCWIVYLSLRRGNPEIANDLNLGAAAEIASYGLKQGDLPKVIAWATSGMTLEEAKKRGDRGKAPPSQESIGN